MTKFKGTTHISAVLDRSGSMAGLEQETISGFNGWLAEVKKAAVDSGNKTLLTLRLFDHRQEIVYAELPVTEAPELTSQVYFVRGFTALRDALGAELIRLDKVTKKKDRALALVITDGLENASKEITHATLTQLIAGAEARENFTIVYLGADQDAFAVGGQLGMQKASRVTTNKDAIGTRSMYRAAAGMTGQMVNSGLRSTHLSQSEYDATDKAAREEAEASSKP
jgi:hypothetical protein